MSHAGTLNYPEDITLATTVTLVTGIAQARTLVLWESDVDVHVVVTTIADGAALPSDGYVTIAAATMPSEINIAPFGYIALAGDGAGTVRAEFRS